MTLELPTKDANTLSELHPSIFKNRQRRKRSTYSPTNAALLKPFFDKIIETNKELCLPYSFFIYCKPEVAYIKTNDALKFLIDCDPDLEKRKLYIILRATHITRAEKQGIVLRRKQTFTNTEQSIDSILKEATSIPQDCVNIKSETSITNIVGGQTDICESVPLPKDGIQSVSENYAPQMEQPWRVKLINFINNALTDNVLEFEFLSLTESDKIWIANVCNPSIVEYLFFNDFRKLKVVKL